MQVTSPLCSIAPNQSLLHGIDYHLCTLSTSLAEADKWSPCTHALYLLQEKTGPNTIAGVRLGLSFSMSRVDTSWYFSPFCMQTLSRRSTRGQQQLLEQIDTIKLSSCLVDVPGHVLTQNAGSYSSAYCCDNTASCSLGGTCY